ncbi:molecular chaperone [candidate division KSB3 bacterium]|uniref:Molecular chaperone n=1 Tax=candidate division KSB3 bacterium TaxID=2044937 RepID=A0A2G6E8B9_9BACT|nr:MAG: molecular chaperone [candidate division KSB3 bacterium]PIE30638.1 MAG: molecular chaperone [candidate division KSB3 bacterium]
MLARWEPFQGIRRRGNIFRDLSQMQEEMNRFFDDFFGEHQTHIAQGQWIPSIDVSESDGEVLVKAELPGMTHEDIEVNLQDNVLTLKGEKKQEKHDDKECFHCLERSYGSFTRSFSLPAGVKAEQISATFKDGVLAITLPKSEEVQPKKISINTAS